MAIKTYEAETTIKIDHDKCTGAGECVDICPVDVYEIVDGKSTAPKVEECIECCACIDACPNKAIEHNSC